MRERDRTEYVDFVTERYMALCRTAYLLTGNHETAEDVVQAVLTRAFVHWGRVRRAHYPYAYVRRMVVNEVTSLRRRRWTRELVVLVDGDQMQSGFVQAGPEDAVVERHDLAAALALTARQRAVVVLRYYDGLSEAEIAHVLGIRPGTVKGHARAGLAALSASLPAEAAREDKS